VKLGLVTYNLAKDWDVATIIERCAKNGFEGVELRTTHAHGVEVTLSATERREVRGKFEQSAVALAGLGSAFEYHDPDPAEVRRNIEGTKDYAKLAADVGAPGIKVRPNGFPDDPKITREQTIRQIGESLAECGEFAQSYGVEVRLEVHGHRTSDPAVIRAIVDAAAHPNVFVCWNSNSQEAVNGSIETNFELLQDRIRLVHMRDLYVGDYPWRELFLRLRGIGYQGFCLAEIPASPEPDRIMGYYRALFDAYRDLAAQ